MHRARSNDQSLDRTAIAVTALDQDTSDRDYWHSRTPAERLAHIEHLRRINYGPDATARLQRVLEIAERT